MAETDWINIPIRRGLHDEAERMAEKRHFPNVSQYVNDAVRRALDDDAAKLREVQDAK